MLIKHQRGEYDYASAEEAAEHVGGLDLATVVTVHIWAGEKWKDVGIIINFFRTGPYLQVEGKGDHQLVVAGIAEEMIAGLIAATARTRTSGRSGGRYWLVMGRDRRPVRRKRGWCTGRRRSGPVRACGGTSLGRRVDPLLPRDLRSTVRATARGGAESSGAMGRRLQRFGLWALTLGLGALLGALVQGWLD